MDGRTNSSRVIFSKTAFIKVLAKVGSTITFIKNNQIVKVLDSSYSFANSDNADLSYYYYYINISNYGIWTVIAELNNEIIDKTIEVTDDRIYDIDLSGILYIYQDGQVNEDITNGMVTTNRQGASGNASGKNPTITWNAKYFTWYLNNGGGTLQSRNKIDVTDYNILDFYAEYTATSDANIRCGISSANTGYWNTQWTSYLSINKGSATLTHRLLDISDITGSYYLIIGGSRVDVVNSANFYEISLRK